MVCSKHWKMSGYYYSSGSSHLPYPVGSRPFKCSSEHWSDILFCLSPRCILIWHLILSPPPFSLRALSPGSVLQCILVTSSSSLSRSCHSGTKTGHTFVHEFKSLGTKMAPTMEVGSVIQISQQPQRPDRRGRKWMVLNGQEVKYVGHNWYLANRGENTRISAYLT